jgi:hypothetical protein
VTNGVQAVEYALFRNAFNFMGNLFICKYNGIKPLTDTNEQDVWIAARGILGLITSVLYNLSVWLLPLSLHTIIL